MPRASTEWGDKRIVTIALMAATLEAGDRASLTRENAETWINSADSYVERAQQLFDAVENLEVPR